MGFLSGLSNIFHGIGHIFGGGDDEQKKKEQQQQQSVQAPQTFNSPTYNPAYNFNPSGPQDPPVKAPELNLFQGSQPLQKANVPVATQQQPQPAPDSLTKAANSTGRFLAGVAHPFTEFGNAAAHVPQAIYREIQNKPINDIQKNVFGTNDSGTIAKKILGDTATIGLTALAPGISNAVEAGTSAAVAPELTSTILNLTRSGVPYAIAKETAEKAAGTVLPNLVKYGAGALGGGTLNTAFSGIQEAQQNGANPMDLLKKVPQNFVTGAALGVAPMAAADLLHGSTNLIKARMNEPVMGNPGVLEKPAEISPGVKVSNANHLEDAIKQTTTPTVAPTPTVATPEPLAIIPHAMNEHESGSLALLDKASKTRVLTDEEQTMRTELQTKATNIDAVNNPKPVTKAPTQKALALDTPPKQPVEAPPVASTPIEAPQTPEGQRMAPDAPRQRKAALKNVGDVAKKVLKTTDDEHAVFSNQELTDAGKAVSDTMSDQDIVTKYASLVKMNSPQEVAIGKAARDRLVSIIRNGTPEEQTAAQIGLNNLVDASSEVVSRGARTTNYAKEMLDGMPAEVKAKYYIKHLDSLNENVKGYSPLADDVPAREAVESNLMKFLSKDEEFRGQIADQQSILEKATNPETRGTLTAEDTSSLKQAKSTIDKLSTQQAQNAGEMARYYDTLTPGRSPAEKFSDWQRTSMLSSPTGRVHAMNATVLGVADQSVKDGVSGLLGKAYNAVVSPEKAVRDTGMNPESLIKGAWGGLKKTVNEARGKFEVGGGTPEQGMKNNTLDNSSEMKAFGGGKFKRLANAATHSHSNITEGIKDAQIVRDARVEGIQQGLKGAELDNYTIARSASPSKMMTERANEIHGQINNLNDNPLTNMITKVASDIAGNSVPGNIIKNQLIPFPRFLAGNIWNQVTDRNVVAAAIKTVSSAVKGDSQGFIDNIAKLGVEGGKTYALGWVLTQHGVLVNHDAQGKEYGGTYVRIGDRYIPASTFGFVAPSLIIGNAIYNAFNDAKTHSGSFIDHLGKTVTDSVINMYKSVSGADLLGAGESITKPISDAVTSKDASKLLKIGTNIASQNIPAVVGDVNSVLNQTSLNPTHEAAQTTVKKINPDTGKENTDAVATAKATLLNKVPIISQTLPRQAGVASTDPLDKVLHSTKDTPTSIQTRVDAKAAVDRATDLATKDMPDPKAKYKSGETFESAVQARIERGEYSKASGGLQAKLDDMANDNNIAQTTKDKISNKIKQLNIANDNKLTFADMKLYNTTSLHEWRLTGDTKSDSYDRKAYEKLWSIDQKLADKGVAGRFDTVSSSGEGDLSSKQKYSAKEKGKGHGGSGNSAESAALKKITSNTLGNVPQMKQVSFGDLAPRKVATSPIPTIQQVKSGDLIKARSISVTKTR